MTGKKYPRGNYVEKVIATVFGFGLAMIFLIICLFIAYAIGHSNGNTSTEQPTAVSEIRKD